MSSAADRSVFIETFGCQMNTLDSELVLGHLRAFGYQSTDDRESADVILYNTCSVRQNAEDKVHGRIGDAKNIKQRRGDVVLGVIGCMAERDGAEMVRRYPQIDLICGPGELDKIPTLIDNAIKTRTAQIALSGSNSRRSGTLDAAADDLETLDLSRSISPIDHNGSAYVRITRGCNKFCTYCVVPFTRGAEIHRPPDHILSECRRLADAGVIEITLLGQTVNHYRYDHGASVSTNNRQHPQVGPSRAAFRNADHHLNVGRKVTTFADLLQRIHDELPAIRRLRFVTSFPHDFSDDILQTMARCDRICNYLHLPAQSGSDRMLKMMNRSYTVGEYTDLIDRTRHYLPDAQIVGDFIVGFPTETDEDFAASVDLLRLSKYKNSYIFKYSPRPGTTAYNKLKDDVPEQVKRKRNVDLLAVQAQVSQQVHDQQINQTLDVLVEGISKYAQKGRGGSPHFSEVKNNVQLSGRTTGDLIVMFEGDESLVGQIVPVRIRTAKPLTLFGELAK